MWANTVWGFLGLAAAMGLAALSLPPEYFWLRPWFFGAAVGLLVASVISLSWPLFFGTGQALNQLNVDDRYLMAIEGIALQKSHFGPYPYGDGEYGGMSWDRVRMICDKLLRLGIIKISNAAGTQGQYAWTPLGRSVLKRLSMKDTELAF
jgi:hypothetical protein